MQFCTTEEHVQLVERAKALLARSSPGASLGKLHLQAMQLLVETLEKRKFAVTKRPRKTKCSRLDDQASDAAPRRRGADATNADAAPRQRGADATDAEATPRQRGAVDSADAAAGAPRQRWEIPVS